MNKTLVIDCNNLCYSSFYTFGDLSYEEKKTGVIFGFLQRVLFLAKKFKTNKFIFCWDSRKSYRKLIYPEYKANRRKDLNEVERKDLALAFKQFDELKEKVLPELGFRNIFRQVGYEADDMIAEVVLKEVQKDFVIVSTDKDLYQLLGLAPIYNQKTKKIITLVDFENKYSIPWYEWVKVKSLMGDPGDNIEGIKDVGIVRAVQYIKSELPKGKILDRIHSDGGQKIINRNMELIALPFEGRKKIRINFAKDKLDKDKFISIFVDHGFESFLKRETLNKWVEAFVN